ncbi:MAG: AAA family ATPase [Paludibacteraceae bacterium]|nr:AAA family ATPase [Paludibacteraceae bacterium]
MNINNRIKSLLDAIGQGLYEKNNLLAYGLLCAIAGESLFLLGAPGTAKSEVSRRLKLIFKDATSFEYLMSRFSTPDEIFGPVSIQKLKDNDLYERRITGYLPASDVVFLDEIWKAGPAIQNALLTVLNEKIFKNGNIDIHIPMKLLIAASNELPTQESGLDAIWDRFIFRAISESIKDETNFCNLLRVTRRNELQIDEDVLITDELYHDWQEKIKDIRFTKPILLYIIKLRKRLAESSDEQPAIYISDRRWAKVSKILRTSAFLNDRDTVDWSDVWLMRYCLWNQAQDIERVCNYMVEELSPTDFKLLDMIEEKLDVISKQRAWKYGAGVDNPEAQQAINRLSELSQKLSEASDKIFSSINTKFANHSNLFIGDNDWKLIDNYIADTQTRIKKNEERIAHERSRFQ